MNLRIHSNNLWKFRNSGSFKRNWWLRSIFKWYNYEGIFLSEKIDIKQSHFLLLYLEWKLFYWNWKLILKSYFWCAILWLWVFFLYKKLFCLKNKISFSEKYSVRNSGNSWKRMFSWNVANLVYKNSEGSLTRFIYLHVERQIHFWVNSPPKRWEVGKTSSNPWYIPRQIAFTLPLHY